MIKILRIINVLLLIGAAGVIVWLATGDFDKPKQEEMPEEMPADFGFSLFYGINGSHHIDTFNGTATKDWLSESKEEVEIEFTDDEMQSIYTKMKEVNVLKDFSLDLERSCSVEPGESTSWEIVLNQKVTTIRFEEYCDEVPVDIKKLMAIEDHVNQLAMEREAFRALPEGIYE